MEYPGRTFPVSFLFYFLVTGLFLFPACVSMGTYQSAWTLRPGDLEVVFQPQMVSRIDESLPTSQPTADLVVRTGIGDRSDVDMRIGPSGIHAGLKLEFVEREKVALSIAPSIGGVRVPISDGDGLHALEYRMPLLLGVRKKPETEFLFAPEVIVASVGWYHPLRFDVVIVDLSVGISHRLFPSLRVHPEVSVGYAFPMEIFTGTAAPAFDSERIMLGAGMGIAFGTGKCEK